MTANRFADLRWAGFLPLMLMRSTKLSATTNVSAEHETPPDAKPLCLLRNSFIVVKNTPRNHLTKEHEKNKVVPCKDAKTFNPR